MFNRSRLRAVLRGIATSFPLIGASCACPKATREIIATYSGNRLPEGEYNLVACDEGRDDRDGDSRFSSEVACRYEHDDNQLHRVTQIIMCDEICPSGDVCYGNGHDVVCGHEDAETRELAEVRVHMPSLLEHPEAYAGSCPMGDVRQYACEYTSPEHREAAFLESLAGFGPTFEHGNDSYWCEVDHESSEITCWHGEYLHCLAGRRPAGAVHSAWRGDPQLVQEAASVPAFEALAAELRAHDAPPGLARAARRAMIEELRHAAIVAGLTGAGAVEVRVERRELRDLLAVALDNAREGCAGEALAAIAAQAVAAQARGPARAALASIARDEAGHALLSFAIDDWARARLGARASRALDEAHREAVHAAVQPRA